MSHRTPHRSRRRGRALAVVVGLAVLASLTACDVSRVGKRCRSGFARDNSHVLTCRNGRWARLMTFGQYLELMARLNPPAVQGATEERPPDTVPPAAPPTTPPTTAPPTTTPPTTTTIPARCTARGFGVDLSNCDLRTADLRNAVLVGALLSGADLTGVDLRGADLTGAHLEGARLGAANLATTVVSSVRSGGIVGTPAALPTEVVLRSGYLVGPKVDLAGAVLDGANLAGLRLDGANLSNARLGAASLASTSLIGAALVGADLDTSAGAANLTGANVTDADLTGLDVGAANLTDVIYKRTVCPNGVGQITTPQTLADC